MQVIVLSTETQKKYTLNMQGETLGDLKRVLDQNSINYNGMVFYEGRTKSELLADDSTLPQDAVIRLTKVEKKIRSGVDRKELYEIIKKRNLGDAIKEAFGKNFTQCKTDDLAKFVSGLETKSEAPSCTSCSCTKEETKGAPAKECGSLDAWIQEGIRNGYIDADTAKQIKSGTKVASISDSDDKLFDFLDKK